MDMLDDSGLTRRFRAIVTADDTKRPKPESEVFHLAASRLHAAPERVLVCEDSLAGVTAAKAAGMKCLAIAANGREALLRSAGAVAVVADFKATRLADLRSMFA